MLMSELFHAGDFARNTRGLSNGKGGDFETAEVGSLFRNMHCATNTYIHIGKSMPFVTITHHCIRI